MSAYKVVRNIVRRTRERVRTDGVLASLRLAGYMLPELYYDWRLGIRSRSVAVEGPYSRPTNQLAFSKIVKVLGIQADRDVFLDYGAGRGRAMIMAAGYPFRRVLGLELSEELSVIARDNIDRVSDRLKCPQVEVINTDATVFVVPPDVTVAYFFDPFGPDILAPVLEQLRASVAAAPRRLRLVYYRPSFESLLAQRDWLAKTRELSFPIQKCCIYESRSTAP